MNFLILGDGPDERAWARLLAQSNQHKVVAAWPGIPEILPEAEVSKDFEAALATANLEAVVIGGSLESRDESLRRVAATGLAAVCLHPPGPNADPYYQVALSRAETGAVVVPDLPSRLHPAVVAMRELLAGEQLGSFRTLRIEVPGDPDHPNLATWTLPLWVDIARVFLGEVESLTALGDPPGIAPTQNLVVQLRGPGGRTAEIRITPTFAGSPARVSLLGDKDVAILAISPDWTGPSSLTCSTGERREFGDWHPQAAVLAVLEQTLADPKIRFRPDLLDGTRAMEVTSAVTRSLKRGRAVDLNYEVVSENSNFKTVMTSVGCMILFGILFILPVALVGPSLGLGQTIYVAYVIPPVLLLFFLMQSLRLVIRKDDRVEPTEKN
jgi:myo-inositol 2-dehydrogenase/D-chiro-inositol 1-dehydrogenase